MQQCPDERRQDAWQQYLQRGWQFVQDAEMATNESLHRVRIRQFSIDR